MKELVLGITILLIIISIIFTGVKNIIISSDLYREGKEIATSFKEYFNTPEIENYNDLISSDIETLDDVKRVNLDWNLFLNGSEVLEGTPIPNGYKLVASFDNYIQISSAYLTNIILPENDMIEFMKSTFLPSDVEFVSQKAYFKKRHKSNGTDTDVGEYLYKSDSSNSYYKISFTYDYAYNNGDTKLNNYYSHATIDKWNIDDEV